MIGSVVAVFSFEWKRALTLPRKAWWLVLAAFPVFIAGLVRFTAVNHENGPEGLWRHLSTWLLFALVPMLVAMLGTLLWTTPAISSELERRSWVYLAVRPHGATAVLLGKYLAAVTWVIPPALVGLTIAVPLTGTGDSWRVWRALSGLVFLSCPAYAAIYLLLGVIFPRRAMVVAVAYTLVFELVVSFIPAVINKMTVQYRLRALAANWCDLNVFNTRESGAMALIGTEPPWHHIVTLVCLTFVLVAAAVVVLRAREFSSSADSDT